MLQEVKQLSTFSGSNSGSPNCVFAIEVSTCHKSWAQGAEESFTVLLFEVMFRGEYTAETVNSNGSVLTLMDVD